MSEGRRSHPVYGPLTEAAYYRCCCGHSANRHSFEGFQEEVPVEIDGGRGIVTFGEFPGRCTVKSCDCVGYDHITGKPDHPLADPKSGEKSDG